VRIFSIFSTTPTTIFSLRLRFPGLHPTTSTKNHFPQQKFPSLCFVYEFPHTKFFPQTEHFFSIQFRVAISDEKSSFLKMSREIFLNRFLGNFEKLNENFRLDFLLVEIFGK
jgi:hypothetical protein